MDELREIQSSDYDAHVELHERYALAELVDKHGLGAVLGFIAEIALDRIPQS